MKAIFDSENVDQLSSASVVDALVEIESSPWGEWHGRPISKIGAARILKRYDLRPTKLRVGETVFNGYRRHDFVDAWSRYLPVPPSGVGTDGTLAQQSQKQTISSRNSDDDVPTAGIGANPHQHTDVPSVPTQEGGRPPVIGGADYLEHLFAALKNGLITEDEWHEGDRAHRLVVARKSA
jgi:hypothetical protein